MWPGGFESLAGCEIFRTEELKLLPKEREMLEELVRFCYIGPRGARVSGVEIEWSDFKGEFRGFKITR